MRPIPEVSKAGYWLFCNLLKKIDQASEAIGKDGKFQIFICVGIRYVARFCGCACVCTCICMCMREEEGCGCVMCVREMKCACVHVCACMCVCVCNLYV